MLAPQGSATLSSKQGAQQSTPIPASVSTMETASGCLLGGQRKRPAYAWAPPVLWGNLAVLVHLRKNRSLKVTAGLLSSVLDVLRIEHVSPNSNLGSM